MNQLVSIILPTYNGAYMIENAIKSVLNQSFSNFELIVVDDGSSDGTQELIFNLQKQDNRIIYIKNEVNLGIQKTLNIGLKKAKGAYIARIDDDDEWINTDKLVEQVDFLNQNKDHLVVGTNAIIYNEKKQELARYMLPQEDKLIRGRMLFRNCFIHPSILVRKEAIDRAGGYNESEEIKHIEDYELWLRLGCIGKMANIKTESVRLTVRPSSLTSKNRLVQARRMLAVSQHYRKKYPNFIIGQIVLLLRIVGFSFLKFIPLQNKLLYKIQKLYKEY